MPLLNAMQLLVHVWPEKIAHFFPFAKKYDVLNVDVLPAPAIGICVAHFFLPLSSVICHVAS